MRTESSRNGWIFIWVALCAAGWLCLFLLVSNLWGCSYQDSLTNEERFGKVNFMDVGQGLAVLIEFDGHYGMYDMGPDSVGVVDSLESRGVDTLDWVVVSHGHRDHGGGFMELASSRGNPQEDSPQGVSSQALGLRVFVRNLYVGPDTARSFVGDSVLRLASRYGIPVDTLYRGDVIRLGTSDGIDLKVLWPPEYVAVGENGASIVMQGSLRADPSGNRFLLTGDLDSAGERRLMELSPDVSAALLQVPHHGSAGSSSLRFLSQVAPGFAVISVGAGNSYGHPREEVLQKLRYVTGDSTAVFRTDRDGTVSFSLVPGVGILR
ncbi:MAG: MBL fold metallo-hydrolase [Fibrobacter sp.]|nr:MBL fold metallo-hydrolase [Fibrobacter sp.]